MGAPGRDGTPQGKAPAPAGRRRGAPRPLAAAPAGFGVPPLQPRPCPLQPPRPPEPGTAGVGSVLLRVGRVKGGGKRKKKRKKKKNRQKKKSGYRKKVDGQVAVGCKRRGLLRAGCVAFLFRQRRDNGCGALFNHLQIQLWCLAASEGQRGAPKGRHSWGAASPRPASVSLPQAFTSPA